MVRFIGAALVAAGGAWLGCQAAYRLRCQGRELRRMSEGLAVLEAELELNASPPPQLLARGAAHGEGPA